MSTPLLRRTSSFLDNPAFVIAQFHEATNGQNSMNFDAFVRATGCKSDIFARKLFEAIDTNNSGDITLDEFIGGIRKLRAPDVEERIEFVFSIFDLDGDGSISGEELKTVLTASVEEEGDLMTEEQNTDLVESLLQLFDTNASSSISYAEFQEVIRTYPDLLSGLTFGRFGMRTAASGPVAKKRFRWIRKASSWVVNNPQLVFTYSITILMLLGCFLWRFMRYAGDCDNAEMELRDPVTGYSRQDVLNLESENKEITVSEGDVRYMVFSKAMAEYDPIECRFARKRKLLSWTLPVAKGCGQAMKATFTLILLPVSRNLMTTLRDTFLKHVFFFDGAIEFHRFLGKVGFWLAWTHTICHAVDVINWQDPNRYRYWSWAFPEHREMKEMSGVYRDDSGDAVEDDFGRIVFNTEMRDGLPAMLYNDHDQPSFRDILTSCVAVTGIILIAIYSFAALFAFDYPKKLSIFKERETGNEELRWRKYVLAFGRWLNDFNNFWYSHHLFSVFYVALLFHPMPNLPDERDEWGYSDSWIWVGVPVAIYLIERAVRVKRSHTSKTRVVGAELLEGNVVGLRFLRPRGFKYTPGQYVFIRCPQISRFEWHPFTLTSCPGDSYLGVHVRKAGDWTEALHELVREHVRKKAASSEGSTLSVRSRYCVKPVLGEEMEVDERFDFSISVDGPFGAPAQNYADYKVIVLIGAGIGVTPFASVLTDLLDSLKQCACPKCGYSNPHHMRTRIRKVYFYWTVRSRSEASWFKHLLEAISLRDEDGLLDIHVNITGIKRANDLRTMMLSLAQYESGEASTSDAISRTVTRFGRINWVEIFDKVKMDFPAEPTVGVFYCGPNTIAKVLNKMCRQNSRGATKFLFMQESFG